MTHNPMGGVSSRRHFTEMLKLGLYLPCTDTWRTGGNPQFSGEESSSAQSSLFASVSKKGQVLQSFLPGMSPDLL